MKRKDCKELNCPFFAWEDPLDPGMVTKCNVYPEECPRGGKENDEDYLDVDKVLKTLAGRSESIARNAAMLTQLLATTQEKLRYLLNQSVD